MGTAPSAGIPGDGSAAPRGLIFDIKRDCSEDGPGIRTTVFFKGCPLSCVWCHNPEGIEARPSLSFDRHLCEPSRCDAPCVATCPEGALRLGEELALDRSACTRCDLCVPVCPEGALRTVGTWISVEDLLYRVLIDRPFFDATNGGVTLSGGEPTRQTRFLSRFLERLKSEGVHTAIETCGFFDYRRFRERLLPHLDLIYFDLKILDDEACRRYTGQSNRLPLSNFVRLVEESEVPVHARIPLIPGITDGADNLSGLARFLRSHGVKDCTLMRYNPLWPDKLEGLGMPVRYQHASFVPRRLEDAKARHLRVTDRRPERWISQA